MIIPSLQVIASPRMGGAETTFLRVVRALDTAGHPVTAGVRRGSDLSRLLDDTGRVVQLPMRNYIDVQTVLQIRQLLEVRKIPLVQTWASRATWLTHAPGDTVHIARLGGYYKLRYFRHADGWVVNTRGLREWLVTKGFPPDRVEWINNFVAPVVPGAAPALNRERLGIPPEALVVIALGRMVEKKGFQDLIPAFARLPREIQGRTVHLVLVGAGPMQPELQAMGRDPSVLGRVHFTGWLDQPLAVLPMADVFVCPSRIEPMGNVVLEAWSMGLPVICTETAGGSELVVSGDNGILTPVKDQARLAHAMESVLREDALRQGLAERGYALFHRHYSEQKTVEAFLDFYRRMLRMKRTGA